MKYLILIAMVLVSNLASAKTQQQILGAQEYKKLQNLESSHREVFKKLITKKTPDVAGILQLKKSLKDASQYQTRFLQKNRLKGVMQRQYAFYIENYISMLKAEIEYFEGRTTGIKMQTVTQGYVNASKDYNTLLNETPKETAYRLGGTMAGLQRQTDEIFGMAKEGRMPVAQAIELLQTTIPRRFKEMEEEQLAVNASMGNHPEFLAASNSSKWIQIGRINSQVAVNLANSLARNDTALIAQAIELRKQSTAIIDSLRGGPAPNRATASSIKK